MNAVVLLKVANDSSIEIPMFDPVVARHLSEASSMTSTLMDEVFVKEIYAPLFKGRKDLTFLDIGANIGLVSLYASDACSRIVAIEPAPDTFTVLKAMTLKHPNIEPFCAALAPVDGPAEFFTNEQNTTASSTVNTYGRFSEVPGLTLTSILSIHQLEHVDVVKCDAEGSEGESLTPEQLDAAKDVVGEWYVEVHNCPKNTWQDKMQLLLRSFNVVGYRGITIHGMTIRAQKV